MYGKYSINYEEWASKYDPCNSEMGFLNSLSRINGARVLDLGCGTGRLSYRLAEIADYVVGLDNDLLSLDVCEKKKNLTGKTSRCKFIYGDMQTFQFSETFDSVIFSWSLYQASDMNRAVKNAAKALNDKGTLIVIQPFGGDQEEIFDVEYKKIHRTYTEILEEQTNLCKLCFLDVNVHDFISSFVFKDINEAIRVNNFFYTLTIGEPISKNSKRLDKIRTKLALHSKDHKVILTDITKMIVCKNKIEETNEI